MFGESHHPSPTAFHFALGRTASTATGLGSASLKVLLAIDESE
jgi:hypothetical protein